MVWIPTIEYIIALFEQEIQDSHLMNRDGLNSTFDNSLYFLERIVMSYFLRLKKFFQKSWLYKTIKDWFIKNSKESIR